MPLQWSWERVACSFANKSSQYLIFGLSQLIVMQITNRAEQKII